MEELNIKQKAIGSGVLFPFTLTEDAQGNTGLYPVCGDTELIENNIHHLFLYPVGYRFRQEEYGSNLKTYLEEPNTQALMFIIKKLLKWSLYTYENRINLTHIETVQYEDWLINRLHYRLKETPLEAYTDIAMQRNT